MESGFQGKDHDHRVDESPLLEGGMSIGAKDIMGPMDRAGAGMSRLDGER
jgi:hypothetical protein